ncbi:NYN domain-containing protein, partial [Pseudomonas aeruginosa]
AYAIDRGDPRQQQFQQILRNLGFTVKLKPYIQRADGSAKGDWDVGITIDVLDAAPRVDEVVLLSGDGDFDLLLEKVIRAHGVVATAYGVPGLTANALIRAASRYVPIEGGLLLKG